MTLRHKSSRCGVGVHEGCDDAFKKDLAHVLHNGLVIGVEVAGGQPTHTLENHLVVVGGEREVEHKERQHARRTVWKRGGEEVRQEVEDERAVGRGLKCLCPHAEEVAHHIRQGTACELCVGSRERPNRTICAGRGGRWHDEEERV